MRAVGAFETGLLEKNVRKNFLPKSKTPELKILILSSSLLTERVLHYSDFLRDLSHNACIEIWTTSKVDVKNFSELKNTTIKGLPVTEAKSLGALYLKWLNDYMWDYQLSNPSRQSKAKWGRITPRRTIRALKIPAYIGAKFRLAARCEKVYEKYLCGELANEEIEKRLAQLKPDLILATGPHRAEEPPIVAAARKMNIPVLAFVTSWDNLSTKSRAVFKYDGYIVWSEELKRQLLDFQIASKDVPIRVVGAPQYDVFFRHSFWQTRTEFCRRHNLNPHLPIIVYALGSPNGFQEFHGALHLAKKIQSKEFGELQMIVRPHPIFDNAGLNETFAPFKPYVIVQNTGQPKLSVNERFQDEEQLSEWINTFFNADVVVNLSSTVTVDAALFDVPIVNLDFDPEPLQPNQNIIKDINRTWTHFSPIAKSGGVWLVKNFDEMCQAILTYLVKPELHREQRKWIADYVCGETDGASGKRMAETTLDFAHRFRKVQSRDL